MRETRMSGSEGGEAFNPLSLPLSGKPGGPTDLRPLTSDLFAVLAQVVASDFLFFLAGKRN